MEKTQREKIIRELKKTHLGITAIDKIIHSNQGSIEVSFLDDTIYNKGLKTIQKFVDDRNLLFYLSIENNRIIVWIHGR
jgi:uncharacterized alpha/beta hydrolase family protein